MGLEGAKAVDFCETFPTWTPFNITYNNLCCNDSYRQVSELSDFEGTLTTEIAYQIVVSLNKKEKIGCKIWSSQM